MTALPTLRRPALRTGRRDVVAVAAMALCVLTPVLVGLDATAAVRGPVGVAFFLVVPGLALTSLLRVEDPVAETGLVFGVGLAVLTLGAEVMVNLRAWHPAAATDVVAGLSFAVLAGGLAARATRSVAEPEPELTTVSTSPSERGAWHLDTELVVHMVLLADAAVLWAVSLGAIHVGGDSGVGLVAALPWTYFLALATLTVGFGWALASRRDDRDNTMLLAAYTVLLVLVLHATTAALYPEPRYAWVYKHLGVIDYISVHGSVNRDVDIYQNWPGFFALAAWFSRVTGWSPISFAAWAQPAFELLNVAALVFCFRGLTRDRRVIWCAVWIFVVANWLGQDYLSPQAFAFFEGMIVVGIVLRCARRDWSPTTRTGRRWARAVDWGRTHLRAASPSALPVDAPLGPAGALVCGALCFAAVVFSHQLTPFVIVVLVAVLVLLRRARPVWLPVAMLAATLAWLAFAWPFVSSHFALFSPGAVSTAHPSGFRSGHALPGVHLVDMAKVALVAAVVVLAAAGLLLRMRERRADIAVAALAAAPVVPAALQSYGGEGWLRALLFALPWLAFLAAPVCLALPRAVTRRASWSRLAWVTAISAVLLPLFLFAYFGQETVNYMSRSDVAVNRWYLRHAPAGSVVSFVAGNAPARLGARYADMSVGDGATTVTDLPGIDGAAFRPADLTRIVDMLSSQRGTARYLVSSPSQTRFLAYYGIVPDGWVRQLDATLAFSPRFRLVDRDGAALVFQLLPARRP